MQSKARSAYPEKGDRGYQIASVVTRAEPLNVGCGIKRAQSAATSMFRSLPEPVAAVVLNQDYR